MITNIVLVVYGIVCTSKGRPKTRKQGRTTLRLNTLDTKLKIAPTVAENGNHLQLGQSSPNLPVAVKRNICAKVINHVVAPPYWDCRFFLFLSDPQREPITFSVDDSP